MPVDEPSNTKFIALHNFSAEEQTDLPLEKGQLVIGHTLEDEWWVGEDPAHQGPDGEKKTGVFPANFVAEVNSEAANKCLRKLAKKDPNNKHVLAANIRAKAQPNTNSPEYLRQTTDGVDFSAHPKATASMKDLTEDLVEVKIEDEYSGNEDVDAAESEGEEDEDGESKTAQTSQEAAASAAAASETKAPVAQVKSIWRRWKPKIWMAGFKCVFAMLSFTCLAGSQFHNIRFSSLDVNGAVVTRDGVGSSAVWYIVTAVQFSIAWGILMWMFEFCLVIIFVLRERGELPDSVQIITDSQPQFFMAYDMVSLFMLSVAGFNMGATASLPGQVIKLLLETNGNCTTSTSMVNAATNMTNSTNSNSTSGTGVDNFDTAINNLNICKILILFLSFVNFVSSVSSCCSCIFYKFIIYIIICGHIIYINSFSDERFVFFFSLQQKPQTIYELGLS